MSSQSLNVSTHWLDMFLCISTMSVHIYVMPIVLNIMTLMALSVAPFVRSKWLKHGATCLFGHVMPFVAWHDTDSIINSTNCIFLVQDDQNVMQYDFFSHLTLLALASASSDANGTVSGTIVFIKSTAETKCNITFFGHVVPLMLVSVSLDANSVIICTIPLVRSRWSKRDAT